MKEKKNIALKTGTIFSIVSLLLTFTIAIPMYSVMPAIVLEQLISGIVPRISYAEACKISLCVFVILFLVTLYVTMRNSRKTTLKQQQTSSLRITFTMVIFYFLVHPIGYYLLMWYSGFPIDALNTLMSIGSFPFTSLSFVVIGFFIDRWSNKKQKSIPV